MPASRSQRHSAVDASVRADAEVRGQFGGRAEVHIGRRVEFEVYGWARRQLRIGHVSDPTLAVTSAFAALRLAALTSSTYTDHCSSLRSAARTVAIASAATSFPGSVFSSAQDSGSVNMARSSASCNPAT